MNATEFESSLKQAGFQDIETKKVAANTATHPHSHAFSVRALVLEGDITLTSEGQSRTFRAGELFRRRPGFHAADTGDFLRLLRAGGGAGPGGDADG